MGKRQVKSSALCLETIKMKTYSIHSQVIEGKKNSRHNDESETRFKMDRMHVDK